MATTSATEPAAQIASGSARSSRRRHAGDAAATAGEAPPVASSATVPASAVGGVAYPSGVAMRPAPTVSFVASSIRMKLPVSRLRA